MKKFSALPLAILLICCFVLCSCELYKHPEHEIHSTVCALEINGSENMIGNHADEYEPWSIKNTEITVDNTVPKTLYTSLFEEKATSEYIYSKTDVGDLFQTNYYKSENGDIYKVKHETGAVIGYTSVSIEQGEPIYSQEECLQIASEFAKSYIILDEYTLSSDESDNLYSFYFDKMSNGIRTADGMSVSVEKHTGRISQFDTTSVGMIEDSIQSSVYELVDVILSCEETTINEKIKSIYSGYVSYEPDYTIKSKTIYMLADSLCGVMYDISVEIKNPATESKTSLVVSESIRLLLKI